MGFFKRKRQDPRQDGLTAETALRMPAIGSASAISIEYKTLGKLFGREGTDWRIHDRIRSKTNSGRQIEKFICETRDGRKVIYFDITDVLKSADPEPVQDIVDAVMRRQRARPLTITLQAGAFLMLYKIIEEVGDQFASKQFDPKDIRGSISQTLAEHDITTAEQLPMTLSIADWVNVLSITRLASVQNLPAEELLNDLRGQLEGALKQVGPG